MDRLFIGQVTDRLRQANTWLIIALFALAGWTIDALRMFLEMHPTPLAGLGAFASHFWYAAPVLAAILILTHLHPQPQLLSLAVYDEQGEVIQREGDFRLDEAVTQPMLISFRGGVQRDGLQYLDLPSGARAYFMHDGGRTIVACFSGPASATQVDREITLTDNEGLLNGNLLEGLSPEAAAVAANVVGRPVEQEVLTFFRRHRKTAITAGDLAHWACHPQSAVEAALEHLRSLQLVQRQHLGGQTFYRLSEDARCGTCLEELFTWQDQWRAQARRVEALVGRGPVWLEERPI